MMFKRKRILSLVFLFGCIGIHGFAATREQEEIDGEQEKKQAEIVRAEAKVLKDEA